MKPKAKAKGKAKAKAKGTAKAKGEKREAATADDAEPKKIKNENQDVAAEAASKINEIDFAKKNFH